jgi:hypothetical protein
MTRIEWTAISTGICLSLIAICVAGRSFAAKGQEAQMPANHEMSDEQVTGPYDVVKDWPKPMSTWPGHKGWTWGSTQAIFAQNPNRIFIAQRGELPALKSPVQDLISATPSTPPQIVEWDGGEDGPVRLSVPIPGLPPRNASTGPTTSPGEPHVNFLGIAGKDYRWEDLIFVVDGEGNLVESWTQWDKLFKRPHRILISPYDPEKRVWIVDDGRDAIFIFSNDGKKLLQTIGTPNEPGDDDKHFNRETDIAWLPEGTFFVSDGYEGTRVVKFDKDGRFLMAWGKSSKGMPYPPPPNYFNTVHGIAVDPVTRRVFVSDRSNHRIQVFDENGKFVDLWPLGEYAVPYHLLLTADRHLWIADGHGTFKILEYDLSGKLLYSWGTWGPFPGELWGVHQLSTDQNGNLYVAEVLNGRAQKFRPKKDADPAKLVGEQMRVGWKQ